MSAMVCFRVIVSLIEIRHSWFETAGLLFIGEKNEKGEVEVEVVLVDDVGFCWWSLFEISLNMRPIFSPKLKRRELIWAALQGSRETEEVEGEEFGEESGTDMS